MADRDLNATVISLLLKLSFSYHIFFFFFFPLKFTYGIIKCKEMVNHAGLSCENGVFIFLLDWIWQKKKVNKIFSFICFSISLCSSLIIFEIRLMMLTLIYKGTFIHCTLNVPWLSKFYRSISYLRDLVDIHVNFSAAIKCSSRWLKLC